MNLIPPIPQDCLVVSCQLSIVTGHLSNDQ